MRIKRKRFLFPMFFICILAMSGIYWRATIDRYLRLLQKKRKVDACFVGGRAPDIDGTTQFGRYWSLGALKGKVVVLDFTANACVYCGPAHEMLARIERDYKREDLVFASISLDETLEERDKAIRRRHIEWPMVWEPLDPFVHPVSKRYGVFAIPSIWIIGRDGTVIESQGITFEPLLRWQIQRALAKN
jgi:peroxiredoxin